VRPVTPQPEPVDFNPKVRVPGKKFLTNCPSPTTREYRGHHYWQEITGEIYEAYSGMCAYLCHWIPKDVARPTIDHYRPKVKYPNLAYEWSNLRLCSEKINSYKDEHEDVLDPFTLKADWFAIDFATYLIEPGAGLTQNNRTKVETTITRLRLNLDDNFVQQRCRVVGDYVDGGITLTHMDRKYPFIADELRRQDLTETIKQMYKTRKK
jgi:uncharacterized protein (TIGR02646 family)